MRSCLKYIPQPFQDIRVATNKADLSNTAAPHNWSKDDNLVITRGTLQGICTLYSYIVGGGGVLLLLQKSS